MTTIPSDHDHYSFCEPVYSWTKIRCTDLDCVPYINLIRFWIPSININYQIYIISDFKNIHMSTKWSSLVSPFKASQFCWTSKRQEVIRFFNILHSGLRGVGLHLLANAILSSYLLYGNYLYGNYSILRVNHMKWWY